MAAALVDARGKTCPQPLIMTRQALRTLRKGETLKILIDNETSKNNIERFLADNGLASSCTGEHGIFTLIVTKSKDDLPRPDAETYCAAPAPAAKTGSHVIVISSDKMGSGPDELGAILLKAFVNTVKEVAPLPSKIVFYNSGILLTAEGSPLIDSLKALEQLGVAILVCGTCVNYFQKQHEIRVGTVSNMFTILESLTAASNLVRP